MDNKKTEVKYVGADKLLFDSKNPRMVEFGDMSDETKVINTLWQNMAVNEIVMSILANGFFENEPMYAIDADGGKYTVIEGNRRLAAVKAILDPDIVANDGMKRYRDKITPAIKKQLRSELPVVVLESRESAWRLIGFKHVNGAVKWDSLAKAEYIAQVHNSYNVPLEDIATQIGDSNKTTIRLYQGLMVLRQAESETEFSSEDKYYSRLYFSHLYTAIGYEGYQNFLGLDLTQTSTSPVPQDHLKNLEQLMFWLYGSKQRDLRPIIKSQNPDLRNLNNVLLDSDSTSMLIATSDFRAAFENSQDGLDLFSKSIMDARVAIEKAQAKLSFYDGSEEIANSVLILANQADTLFSSIKAIRAQKLSSDQDKQARTID